MGKMTVINMSWYKKAQKIPTMQNIIWAIDKLIAENYEFSEEELYQAFSRIEGQEYAIPKAAQVATKRKPRLGRPQKRKETRQTQYSKIFDLFEKGVTPLDISRQLNIPSLLVHQTLKTRFQSKSDRDEYLRDKHEENILDTTDELTQEMKEDINIEILGAEDIAHVLNINTKFVAKVLKENNINLSKLVAERRDQISEMIAVIVKDLPYGFTAKDVIKEFKNRHNFKLSLSSAHRALTLNNLGQKKKDDPDAIFKSFTTYVSSMLTGGRARIIKDPQKLSLFIDRFFQQYGEKHGFVPPLKQKELKRKFLTELQMRENTLNMERNKYTPVDMSQNNPAYFLNNPEGQNELV